jgi:hypothetical protein
VSKKQSNLPGVVPPAVAGEAGPQFEAKVGAFYLLSLLAAGEPRGLPGATIKSVACTQRVAERPLDDVVVEATNADGTPAVLEIQAKRSMKFTAGDHEFAGVVMRIWVAAQKPEFNTSRYELAVAISRTTTRIENACQEVLHWARHLPDSATFGHHIALEGFSSKDMRDFVDVFRQNLNEAGGPTGDETVWQLLRRFQILVFDFESAGSDYEHRVRERARLVLVPEQAHRAAELWPVLIEQAGACARAGGAFDHVQLVGPLRTTYGHLEK